MKDNLKDFPPMEEKLIDVISDDYVSPSLMQTFYKDKGVFLTGGTGFFGKIIIEKLLRVTEVAQIYVLIRNKKGKDVYARIDELFDDAIFDELRKINPKFRQKITTVSGDCSLPALGISPDEREMLQDNVNIVIHGAATVRFDEKLKMAIAINVHGTMEIIKLAKEIVHLKALVHVSTAFAHCNRAYIEEKFYPSTITGDKACRLQECLDEHTLNMLTPSLISGYPNTYTFTKVLAEDIIQQQAAQLPVVIFRPGIVISTYKEPIAGWIDNMYGPCGVVVGIGAGVLRVFNGNDDNKANIVPVDLAVNALLASAWDIARNTYETPPIYNYVPDAQNMVSWKEYVQLGFEYGVNVPLRKCIWYPCFTIVSSAWLSVILTFFYHTLPAFIVDVLLVIVGKKPRMMKIYRKVHKFRSVMEYFSSNAFQFNNDNVKRLSKKLMGADQDLFAFDMLPMDWHKLIKDSLVGLRLHVVKDDPNDIPEALKRFHRLKILHYSTLFVIYAALALALVTLLKWIFF